jgi:tRNA(adenine34) deaminase
MADPAALGRDTVYMRVALEHAAAAGARGEVPVGAVLVRGADIIATGGNAPIARHDPTAHAEIEALRAGGRALGSYRLTDSTLYVTLEPCVMCAAAIVHARVRRLVFGAWDPRAGAAGSIADVFALPQLNHRVDVFGGVLMEECAELLQRFFAERR